MNKEELIGRLEELIDDKQVTFGYNPKGDEDWFVSIRELKELIKVARCEVQE